MERKDRKGKNVSKEQESETHKRAFEPKRGDITPKAKSSRPAVSFASPPSSPNEFLGLLSPSHTGRRTSKKVGRTTFDDILGSTEASSSTTPLSTHKFKKFKGTEIEGINNPFKAMRESMGAGSLLTPSKTPAMKRRFPLPAEGEIEEDTLARNLFETPKKATSSESAQALPPTSKSLQKKKLGGAMGDVATDLFGSANILGATSPSPIPIFTDTNAKIPEYDPSPENPFIHHPPEVQRMTRSTRSQKKTVESQQEFEQVKGGREDGMVYKYRGQTIFRKFEKDSSSILGGGPMRPRVLFPSANKAPVKPMIFPEEEEDEEDEDEEIDAFSAISKFSHNEQEAGTDNSDEEYESAEEEFLTKTVETTTFISTSITTVEESIEKNNSTSTPEPAGETEVSSGTATCASSSTAEEKEAVVYQEQDQSIEEPEKQVQEGHVEAAAVKGDAKVDETKGKKNERLSSQDAELVEPRGRAASVAPSVSSVASSNILSSFTRRPRITKSVSNLGNSDCAGGLRRSKRLLSVEPLPMPPITDSDKTSIKHKLSAKRGRSEDVALEETEKWALGIAGGIRKRVRNHESA